MAKIKWSPTAIDDILSISEYLSEQAQVPNIAIGTINEIYDRIKMLETFPHLGARLDVHSNDLHRYLVCDDYVAIYKVVDDTVYIEKIAYKRENYIVLFTQKESMVQEEIPLFNSLSGIKKP